MLAMYTVSDNVMFYHDMSEPPLCTHVRFRSDRVYVASNNHLNAAFKNLAWPENAAISDSQALSKENRVCAIFCSEQK